MNRYVVVLERRGVRQHPLAAMVEARTIDEAVTVALEGESWQTEDGVYDVHVAALDDLEQRVARRHTDTNITVEEATQTERVA